MREVRGCFLGVMVMFFLVGLALPVRAAGPSTEFTLDAMSKYVWRGGVYSDSAVLQPAMTISYKGFSWGFGETLTLATRLLGMTTPSAGRKPISPSATPTTNCLTGFRWTWEPFTTPVNRLQTPLKSTPAFPEAFPA